MISIAHIAHYVFDATITYDDVAPDQRLSHGGALRLLQEAAAVASDLRGYGLKDIPRNGVAWILTGWRLELLERPAWNTAISVETWPRSMDGFLSDRDFLLRSGETLVARGTSRWFLVSAATGRIVRITPEVRSAYELDETRIFPGGDDIPGNGKSPADARETFSYTVGRRDIDTNHHVNNIHYLDFALEALPRRSTTICPPRWTWPSASRSSWAPPSAASTPAWRTVGTRGRSAADRRTPRSTPPSCGPICLK